jgi:hypothetical protein
LVQRVNLFRSYDGESIITTATITSGEKTDRKELPALVYKIRNVETKVETVIGDKR